MSLPAMRERAVPAMPSAPLGREPDGNAEGAEVLVISTDALRRDLRACARRWEVHR